MRRTWSKIALALFSGLLVVGCGSDAKVTMISVEVTPPAPSIGVSTAQQFTATAIFSNGTKLDMTSQAAWTTSDDSIATVDAAGNATGVAVGEATITATYDGQAASATLTVTAATVVSIDVTPADPSIAAGTTQQLAATATMSDSTTQDVTAQVTWSSSNDSIATIGTDGQAMGVTRGTVTITAALAGTEGSTTLTVTAATLVSIQVTPVNPSAAKGTTVQFTATGTFTDNSTQDLTTQVVWASGTLGVATISNAAADVGLATTVDLGTSSISAALPGVTGNPALTVTAATLVSIDVTPSAPSIAKGTTQQFTATGTYTDNSTQDLTTQVVWASDAHGVATISNAVGSEGLANSVDIGTATITAGLNVGGSITSGSTDLTVTAATVVSVDVTPADPSIAPQTTIQFTATAVFTDSTTQDVTATAAWDSTVDAVAGVDINTGLATSVTSGVTSISATFDGVSGATDLTVTAATLSTITVAPTNPTLPRGNVVQATATGTFSDSTTQDLTLLVTWSSTDDNIAAVATGGDAKGEISAENTGSATISAAYLGVTGTTNVTVTPAELVSIAVTPRHPSAARGTTQQFAASGTYTDKTTQDLTTTVAWTSSDIDVATISSAVGVEGLANALNVGTVTITAGSGAVTGSTTFAVTPAALVSIAVTPTNPSVAKGTSQQFTATGTYSDNTTQDLTTQATWSWDPDGITTVSNAEGSQGLASTEGEGTATITATLDDVSGSTDLEVTPAVVASVSVSPSNPSAADGTTLQFTATATFSDNSTQDVTSTASWSTGEDTVATIETAGQSDPGLATAVDPGSTLVSASFSGFIGSTTLTVTPAALVSIAVTPSNPDAARGTQVQFTATGAFTDSSTQDITTQVTWGSSDDDTASVSNAVGSEGLADANNVGEATIEATLDDVTGSTLINVTAATLVSIAVTPTNRTRPKGLTVQFEATGTYTDTTTQDLTSDVTWSWTPDGVATVSNADGSEGLGTAVDTGTATITATLDTIEGSTDFTVTAAELVSIAISPADASIAKGFAQQLTATGTYTDDSTQDVTTDASWSSSDDGIAFVSSIVGSKGLTTALEEGTITVTASLDGVDGTTGFTVNPATLVSISINPLNPVAAASTTVRFTATGNFSDSTFQDLSRQVSWSSSELGVATILSKAGAASGIATAVSTGESTITAALDGLTADTELTVTPSTLVSIAVTPDPATVNVGRTVQMTATGTFSDTTTQDITTLVAWKSNGLAFATVSNAAGSEGLVSGVNEGGTSITAELGGISDEVGLMVAPSDSLDAAVGLDSGVYDFNLGGTYVPLYVDGDYDGGGWVLVGRGREGWAWNNSGRGDASAVKDDIGTPAAFSPVYLSAAQIQGMIDATDIDLRQVEIRIKRATNVAGTSYQNVIWQPPYQAVWNWVWDTRIFSVTATSSNVAGFCAASGPNTTNTRDAFTGSNCGSLRTWAHPLWNNQVGFTYYYLPGAGSDTATSFLWRYQSSDGWPVPYAEVYIRQR